MKTEMVRPNRFKTLKKITTNEWESICCRCGICCLNRIYDHDRGKVRFSRIACRHLDLYSCNCMIYHHRFDIDNDCGKMTPEGLVRLHWLPSTCGYRTVLEGRSFDWWHPLVSGDPQTVHRAGISIRNAGIISESDIIAGDLLKSVFLDPFKVEDLCQMNP